MKKRKEKRNGIKQSLSALMWEKWCTELHDDYVIKIVYIFIFLYIGTP